MPTGIKFISSLSGITSTVGIGLSTIVGPTGPAGAFGGPQGFQGIIGPQGMSPTGTNYGDYLYWNGTGSFVVGDANVNLGSKSGEQSVGLYNVAIGYNAGFTGGFSSGDPFASTATGTSIAIGYYAGYEQACNSIAIGNNAGYFQDFNNIAIGSSAGYLQNEINNIAIGIVAGFDSQGTGGNQNGQGGNSIAIGSSSGQVLQGYESVAIGYYAAEQKQGHNSVAIGVNAGEFSQGNFSVAIGTNAGVNNQANESIIINASSSSTLNASTSGLFINPIRNSGSSQTLFYDPSTKEITYYSTGSNGPQGFQGLAGTTGTNGVQGNQGNQGNQGDIGQGFKVFATTPSYTGLNTVIATGGNVGEFVLITGGDLFVYSGTGAGSTGPGNSYEYAGDVTDESKLIGFQGSQGNQGFQGLMGPTGPGFSTISNPGNNRILLATGSSTNSAVAYPNLTFDGTTLSAPSMSGGTIYANKINVDQGGIYFSTGSTTGCFIDGVNYNTTGADHYVYYNSRTHELTQSSPVYFFSYATGTQLFTGTNNFQPVSFDANNILYHTFQHVGKSSVFTGTFQSQVVLNFEYSLQMHTTANGVFTTAAALYLDDVAIAGSYRSVSIKDNNAEYILSNDIIVIIPSGGHKIELKAATTNTSTQIGGVPNIPSPGQSYTSANLRCSRII